MNSKGYSNLHGDKSTVRLYTLVCCLVHEVHSDTQHYAYNEQLELQHEIKRAEKTKQNNRKNITKQTLAWALEIATVTLFLFRMQTVQLCEETIIIYPLISQKSYCLKNRYSQLASTLFSNTGNANVYRF